ncbi:MAG: AI-2E family transporter [Elusimicrobia bacterium]|nr:AI-2E family transporter [Elusimicrobiota bacterium]
MPPSLWPALAFFGFVAYYDLGPALIAGLYAYTILDVVHRKLALKGAPGRWLAVAVFAVVALGLSAFVVRFFRQSASTLPVIAASVLPMLSEFASEHGYPLPFGSLEELRELGAAALREHGGHITRVSGVLTRGFFHIAMAVSTAVLCFTSGASGLPAAGRFMRSFELVAGAQVAISAINTAFTAAFLLAMGFPHAPFLIPATFFLGMLPLVGNLLSNTMIVCAGLTVSPRLGLVALAFLVVIHKAEYFLNSRIVGESLKTPMWQTLLGIFVGEMILGVPGILLAPAAMHFVREELSTDRISA